MRGFWLRASGASRSRRRAKASGRNLSSNAPPQFRVRRLIDVAHSSGTEMSGDVVVRQLATNHEAELYQSSCHLCQNF